MPPLVPRTGTSVPASSLRVGQFYDVFYRYRSIVTGREDIEFAGRGKYAGKGGAETYLFKLFVDPDGNLSTKETERIVTTNPLFRASPPNWNPIVKLVAPKSIPAGSEDAITREDIKNGDSMIDFDNEASFNRYYLETTYPQLRGKNPFTNNEIDTSTVQKYTAKITEGGKRRYRKNTMRRRKTRGTKKKST